MSTKFSYPDIPYIEDRTTYDYLFKIDRLLRSFGATINKLEEAISKLETVTNKKEV